jgi:GDPmannose 4,6-dehydratase/GDP-4-dehydro-6-deoxy-D-mannose reductase
MKNCLITGITGSGGSYLADYIIENQPEYKVWGICRWHSSATQANVDHLKGRIDTRECDLLDMSSIIRTLRECMPERIFHLAAFANVRKCFDTPIAVVNNNIMSTANLLEAVRLTCPDAIVQICSTSEVYGNPEEFPMTENHPLKPVNPYSVSKLASEALAYAYFKSWKLNIIITRMFAYVNPRRIDLFATAFAHQIARIEAGRQDILRHGNLDSIRTLIDIRDAMESYWVASGKCSFGEAYNIGGNTVLSVGDVLKIMIEQSKCPIKTFQDPDLMRPIDVTRQVPDTRKFQYKTGWSPKYRAVDSIGYLLDYRRKVVANER